MAFGRQDGQAAQRGNPDKGVVVSKHGFQTTLGHLRREVTDELAYLLEGFFANIEVQFFEIAGQRTARERELSDTIRELLSKREDITLGFCAAVNVSMDNWLHAEQEESEDLGDDSLVAESASSAQGHFARILEEIDRRSHELVEGAAGLESLPIAPEPLCRCFVATCRDMCVEGISLGVTAVLFRRLVLDRLGDLYGRINRKLSAEAPDHQPVSCPDRDGVQEEIIEIESIPLYASSTSTV
jgi:hypothetical protein